MNEKLWLAIAFFTFLGILLKYVRPHILKIIDYNSQQIADNINSAKQARQKANNLLKEAEEYLEETKSYSKQLVIDAQNEAQKIIKDTKDQVEEEISKKTKAALSRIKMEEEKSIREFKADLIEGSINRFAEVIADDISDKEASILNKKASDDIAISLNAQK